MTLKEKVFHLFSTDSALQGLLGGTPDNPKVYSHHPLSSIEKDLPCITYRFTEQPPQPNIKGQTLKDGLLQVDIWSRGNADEIEDRVQTLLKNTLDFKANIISSHPLFELDLALNHQQIIAKIIGG